jgi:hypothetical protein
MQSLEAAQICRGPALDVMAQALVGGRSNIPHLVHLFPGCGTQHTETFVDLPPTIGYKGHGLRLI